MDGGAWWATVHGVAKSRTGLSHVHFHQPHSHRRSVESSCYQEKHVLEQDTLLLYETCP